MFAALFGLKDKTGNRLIRESMLNMAKKGGKSAIGGLLAVIMTFFDGERDCENYVVANKTEQAMFCWGAAKSILTQLGDDDPTFEASYQVKNNNLEHKIIDKVSNNFFKTLPYESKSLDGVNPHFCIIDEFHEYPNTKVPDNLISGMALRQQPMMLYVTTRGFHPFGPLAQKEEYYESVLSGMVEDDRVFPLIYSMDAKDNWKNSNHWIKCCPGLEYGLPSVEFLEQQVKKGLQEGGETLIEKKTKNFNIWQRTKEEFVKADRWLGGSDPIEDMEGRECYAAIDLGWNDDLSCIGYLFPPVSSGERFKYLLRTFIPEGMVEERSRQHKVSYSKWIEEGYVVPTTGNVTDTAEIRAFLEKDYERYQIKQINADKKFALELLNQLLALNMPVVDFPQTYVNMTPAIIGLQTMVHRNLLQHGGNPVLNWMCSNVSLKKNATGLVMMDKSDKQRKNKIDGMVALAMCTDCVIDAMKSPILPKDYEIMVV